MSEAERKAGPTPGPWHVFRNSAGDGWLLYDSAGVDIAFLKDRLEAARFDESYANARLIAAAPDLLEALEAIVYVCNQISDAQKNHTPGVDTGGVGTMRAFAARAEAALRKAREGQNG
jgi:hypothetical protein